MGPVQYAHWHQFFENISVSSLDFYKSLEAALSDRKIPSMDISRIEMVERGPFSSKRTYLKLQRDWLTYNVCVAPFGTGFFVSSRLIIWPFRSWPKFLMLGVAIGLALFRTVLCFVRHAQKPCRRTSRGGRCCRSSDHAVHHNPCYLDRPVPAHDVLPLGHHARVSRRGTWSSGFPG